ncbi:MAG: CBS domain-containing protein [Prevotellaceae bacterium]|nr:CBS domain-containing protein [Prevotellaceae bacterium]
MEPPSSQYLSSDLFLVGEWVLSALCLLLVFILSVASGMILAFKDMETKQKGNIKQQFTVEKQLMLVEALWIAKTVLSVFIILFIWHLLDLYFPDAANVYLILSKAAIFLLLLISVFLFQRYGTKHIQYFALLYPFIKTVCSLFYPVIKISFPSNNRKSMDEIHNESGDIGDSHVFEALQNTVDIDVKDILSNRMDVAAVDISVDFDTLYSIVVESGYSRLPVYEDDLDHIKGILYVKDLLPHIRNNRDFDWTSLIHEAYFVLEHKKINALLDEMKKKKVHMAIVVDEYGGTIGIVTLEDILEEIVGEIFDESDIESEETFYIKQKDNSYSFKGKTPLIDFCRIMQVDHELFESAKGDTETLAGLLLELKGEFLQKGEELKLYGLTFRVESVDDRKIRIIRVTKNE